MNVNTHRYCDFDADRNCVFFFGADDDEEANSSQWVAADDIKEDHHRRFPYINIFAKTKRFETNEIKCKLVHINHHNHSHPTTEKIIHPQTSTKQSNHSIAKTPSLSNSPPSAVVTLAKRQLVHKPTHLQTPVNMHYAQFPAAYSNLSEQLKAVNPSLPQPQPPHQLVHAQLMQSKLVQPQQTKAAAHAQVHHIMAQYEQRGQRLAQQRAEVEKEIVQRIQCIEELEAKLSQQTNKIAVTTTSPYYFYTQPTSVFSYLKATPAQTRPVVRLPQEYMVHNLQYPYSTIDIGGQQILIGMAANESQIYQQHQQRQR